MNILVTSYQRCYMNCRIYNQGHESTKIDQRRTIRRRERDCNQDKRCHGCRSNVGSSGSFGISASADSQEGSLSVGSRHLHRSTGQEDTKVVRQGQMDSYYEHFCETVAMGLPGRVIDLDVAGLEHEADDEKEERAKYETEVESEVNGYEETALGVLLPILSEAVLSVTGPSNQELNSVPQADMGDELLSDRRHHQC